MNRQFLFEKDQEGNKVITIDTRKSYKSKSFINPMTIFQDGNVKGFILAFVRNHDYDISFTIEGINE